MLAKQRNEAIRHVIAYVFTIVMVFLAVTPFIYVVLTALKTKEQIYDPSQIIPTHITFDNFRHVLFHNNIVRNTQQDSRKHSCHKNRHLDFPGTYDSISSKSICCHY